MKAVQIDSAGSDFGVVERDVPEPASDQVRISVDACGVCGGDTVVKEGLYPGIEYPRVPGHEVAGHIDAVGADVTGWDVGQRVGVGWHGGHCFVCDQCRRGDFINCENASITGIDYDGGYAEYMTAPSEALAHIPDEIDAVAAGPLVCAGVTPYNALRHSDARPGDIIAIHGIGGVGHMGVQLANAMGFETVAVSRGTEKEDLAFELGADHYINAESVDPAKELNAMDGARVVLTTAPSKTAIESITGGLAANGQLVTIVEPDEPIELHLGEFINERRSMQAWNSGHARDSQDTLEFCALRDIEPMTETYPLEQATEAYERMMAGETRFKAVLVPGS